MDAGIDNLASRTLGVHREQRKRVADAKPSILFFILALEDSVARTAGAHQSGHDSGDANAVLRYLGVQAFRQSDERELARIVGKQMRRAYLPSHRSDVHDAAPPAIAHRRKHSE